MKQKSDWKRITLLRKTSFKKEIKILAGYKRPNGSNQRTQAMVTVYFRFAREIQAHRRGDRRPRDEQAGPTSGRFVPMDIAKEKW